MLFFKFTIVFTLFLLYISERELTNGIDVKQNWGYSEVRENAHMFWWLYYANSADYSRPQAYQSYPLIIWLQGGPGGSSTGFGNFLEIGPEDLKLKPRNTTWLKYANLLFIDSPVGTGFSYVLSDDAYAKNNTQIAVDLVAVLKDIFSTLKTFQSTPLYIFSESYGGKMATGFAIELLKAIQTGAINCNFKGIVLGDSWISPIDSVATWGQYLYTMSMIDENENREMDILVAKLRTALQQKNYAIATNLWRETEAFVGQIAANVNVYNILKDYDDDNSDNSDTRFGTLYSDLPDRVQKQFIRHVGPYHEAELYALMNGPVKNNLKIIPANVTWGGQSLIVFYELRSDFMQPVVDQIDYILNHTALQVVIYTGQLDLIVDTLGTLNWIKTLKWPNLDKFQSAQKMPIRDQLTDTVAFYKTYDRLSFYWVLKAGHMVPIDAGNTALLMLQKIFQQT